MKKTLLVTYTPRMGSNTKKMVEAFMEASEGKTELTVVDLAETPPSLLLSSELNTFIKANYTDETLTAEDEAVLAKNNEMTEQVKQADHIVVAYPIYNFSLPATVKAWADAIIQKDKTFTLSHEGFQGICTDKDALILSTAGYELGEGDLATPLMKACLGFIGVPSEEIVVYGMNQFPEKAAGLLEDAQTKIAGICAEWYA